MSRRGFEIGVTLPNYGSSATPDGVRRVAEAADDLGFDSVWATEHLLVAGDAAESYGAVLDPIVTLAGVAGRLERANLGTSIVLLPLHHPVHVAKQAATLQLLAGGGLRLGIGVGWHEPEFRFLGYGFEDRGRRADEALRLMRALWSGETDFHGEYWSFEDAHFGPLPDGPPEVWIGGASPPSLRRARELGDVWHPNRADVGLLRGARSEWPGGRIVPRLALDFGGGEATLSGSPEQVADRLEQLAAAGMDGCVLSLGSDPDEIVAAMRRFADEVRPRLGGVPLAAA